MNVLLIGWQKIGHSNGDNDFSVLWKRICTGWLFTFMHTNRNRMHHVTVVYMCGTYMTKSFLLWSPVATFAVNIKILFRYALGLLFFLDKILSVQTWEEEKRVKKKREFLSDPNNPYHKLLFQIVMTFALKNIWG